MRIILILVVVALAACNKSDANSNSCEKRYELFSTTAIIPFIALPTPEVGSSFSFSGEIFDSLGEQHETVIELTYNAFDENLGYEHWFFTIKVDDIEVGDPNNSLAPPLNDAPTKLIYNIYFDEFGEVNRTYTDDLLISNWVPQNNLGGLAQGPLNVLAGGTVQISSYPTSSNFIVNPEFIKMTDSTEAQMSNWISENRVESTCVDQ